MDNNKIRIGIIGAGYMGKTHAKTYANLDSVEIVGIADIDFSKAEEVAKVHNCKAYKDYEDLLNIPEIDAVSICTSDALHKDPVVAAAKKGKHILLEKPIANNLEDAQTIVDTVRASGVLFQIGFVERFNNSYIVAHQALADGAIGKLISVRAQRMNIRLAIEHNAKRGDDVITFLSIHDIDLLNWFGGKITKINVEAGSYTFPEYPLHNDAAMILARFKSGAIGLVQVTWGLINEMPFRAISKLELVGDKGIIEVTGLNRTVTINSEDGFKNLIGFNRSDAFHAQLSHFIECIKSNVNPKVGLTEGVDSLKIALMAQDYAKRQ